MEKADRPIRSWLHDHAASRGALEGLVDNRPPSIRCIDPLVTPHGPIFGEPPAGISPGRRPPPGPEDASFIVPDLLARLFAGRPLGP